MTIHEAVNEMLEGIGEPSVTSFTTGDGSDPAEAEGILERETKRVLEEGWACNIDIDAELLLPDRRFTYSGAAPAFVHGEVLTQTSSGATGYFEAVDATNSHIYVRWIAGTFTATDQLNGATATKIPTAVTTVAAGHMGCSEDWLSVKSNARESRAIVQRGSRLYDATNATYEFESSVRVERLVALDFADVPNILARYITLVATLAFQKYKKRGQVDEAMIAGRLLQARGRALQEDADQRRIRTNHTPEAKAIKGYRRMGRFGGLGVDENYTA